MKFSAALFLLFFSISLFGQQQLFPRDFVPGNMPSYKPAYQADYPNWAKMLYQEEINFHEVEDAFHQWEQKKENRFRPIRKYFQIWRSSIRPFVNASGRVELKDVPQYNEQILTQQLNAKSRAATKMAGDWNFLGPKETFWLNESGSTEEPKACPWQVNIYTFDIAKSDYNTLYCGTETGYVNKSVDNGLNWEIQGLGYNFGGGVTALAIHPMDKNTVFVAAANQIHRTTDGGQSWTPLLPANQLINIDQLTIDSNNPGKVFTAGASGVYLSEDAGDSWTQVWNQPSYDVHLQPGNSNRIYTISKVAGNFVVATSDDGGKTFAEDANFPSQIADAAGGLLAVSPDAPEALFAILLGNNDTPYLYRGDMDAGNWELIATGQTSTFAMNNGQGFFDLALEVSPIDEDIIFVGASTLYKSSNGGTNFSAIGGYAGPFPIHPDIQDMVVLDNGEAWVATDGGFTHSTDNFSTTQNAIAKNKNLIGSDMWGFDQGWNEDVIVGGRYHNGNTAIADFYQPKSLRMGGAESPTGWIMKGKSRHVAFDDLGPGWILPETAESQPQGRFILSKYPNMDEYGGRRGNMVFHPNYYEVIYLGEGNAFWKSEDMGLSFEMLHNFGQRIRFIDIAFSDPNIIYADVVDRGLYRSDDGGNSWTLKSSLTNSSFGSNYWEGKLHFVISPKDANTIYACLQNGTWSSDIGKIFKSTDGGDNWTDWTGSLNVYTKTLAIQPDAQGNDLLYLFTSNRNGSAANCYLRLEGENDWTMHGSAFPASMYPNHALPFFRDSKIRVAGNGGIWENELAEPDFAPIIQPWVGRPVVDCVTDTIQLEDHSILNHADVSWNWKIEPTPVFIDDVAKRNPKIVLGNPGFYSVTLTITKDGNEYSKTLENIMEASECPTISDCSNPGFLPKENWSLVYVDSEEVNDPGLATMAFDNNPETIWHTRWSTGSDPYPHEIQIDLGEVFDVHEFTYLPRQNGQNGWIKNYELYFSENLDDWGPADMTGAFESSAAPHKVVFQTPVVGRYAKLVALSEANGNPWASAAEFDILGCYHQPVSTSSLPSATSLTAFPVPTTGIFTISLPSDEAFAYAVYNLTGQQLSQGKSLNGQDFLELNLTGQPSGLYLIELKDANGRLFYVKVVKE